MFETIRILLVDDDPVILRSLARPLTDHGFEVVTALCPAEARAIIKRTTFSAVVCDYNMPGQSGLEFLEDLRTQQPEFLTFMLTGQVAGLSIAEDWAREIGVNQVFAKPCDYAVIVAAIEKGLTERKQDIAASTNS